MSRSLDVKVVSQSDELPYRELEIRLGSSRRLRTPTRSIDARARARNVGILLEDARVFELYSRAGASTIDLRTTQTAKQQDHSYDLNAIRNAAGQAPLLVFQEFPEIHYPSDVQIQYLIRTAHAYSDLVTIPLVSRITDALDAGPRFEAYVKFLSHTIEIIDTYNKKPVMGVIPLRTPFIRIADLVHFYCKHGVTAFCLDFAAATPMTARQNTEQVLFALSKEEALKSCFLHALNVSPGKPRSKTTVSPCQSILSYGHDIDSFGDLHRTRTVIKKPPKEPRAFAPRLFSRKDYGDYLARTAKEISAIKPDKTGIALADCLTNRDLARLFNGEQHSLEASSLPPLIRGGGGAGGLGKYLEKKKYVDAHALKYMRTLRTALKPGKKQKQGKLD